MMCRSRLLLQSSKKYLSTTRLIRNSAEISQSTAASLSSLPPSRSSPTLKTLMAANLHLGHNPKVWNKFMLPYIYGERHGIHIINLEHTLVHLRRAINLVKNVALKDGKILFVGSRTNIHNITVNASEEGGDNCYFCLDWVGGMITNKERVLRRSSGYDPTKVAQILSLTAKEKLLSDKENFELEGGELGDVEYDPEDPYPELSGGPSSNSKDSTSQTQQTTPGKQPHVFSPDLIVLLDFTNNGWAAREANLANIPVIAICDTDCDPRMVQYPIPANDDAISSVELIAKCLSMAALEGSETRKYLENN